MKTTSVLLEERDLIKCKELGINISSFCRDAIKEALYGKGKIEESSEILELIDEFIRTHKEKDNWRSDMMPWIKKIKYRTGTRISANSFEYMLKKRSGGFEDGK